LNSSEYSRNDTYGIQDEYGSQLNAFDPRWSIEVCECQLLCELYNFM
jgi:hypothetical protein